MANEIFLIYEGFENDAQKIFNPLLDKFEFKINGLNNYGIVLQNELCKLNIFREVSLQIWIYNNSNKNGCLMGQVLLKKDEYIKYKELVFNNITEFQLKKIVDFIIKYSFLFEFE